MSRMIPFTWLMVTLALVPVQAQEGLVAPLDDVRAAMRNTKLTLPAGGSEELSAFLDATQAASIGLSKDYRDMMSRLSVLQREAADKVLSDDGAISDESFYVAAQFAMAARIGNFSKATAEERLQLLGQVQRRFTIGLAKGLNSADISSATQIVSALESNDDAEVAKNALQHFVQGLKAKAEPRLASTLEAFEGNLRRLALLGNEIELTGKLADGSEFDWSSYRGKVVLVDFWATWCGPCLAEAPNVRKNYEAYHDQGFEIVGISLDTNAAALQSYVEKESIPWANLFEEKAGWKHPMAVKYGIHAIPSVFLVNREGKVVSLKARGSQLTFQLETIFGPRLSPAAKAAVKGDWATAAIQVKKLADETPNEANNHLGLAAAHLLDGNHAGYQAACKSAFAVFGDYNNVWAQAKFVWMCGMGADCGVSQEKLESMANDLLSRKDDTLMRLAKMSVLYRQGNFRECIEIAPLHGDLMQRSLSLLVRAMASKKLDDEQAANKFFDEGSAIVQEHFLDASQAKLAAHMADQWICCAVTQAVLMEAKAVLEKQNKN